MHLTFCLNACDWLATALREHNGPRLRGQTWTARMLLAVVASGILGAPGALDAESELKVTSDFSGGSGLVEKIDQAARLIRLTPTPHPDRGWAVWWYLKITGIRAGETITLDVGDAPWATPDRAQYSLDNAAWKQTGIAQRAGKRFIYRQKIEADHAWFAWGPPFTYEDAVALAKQSEKDCPHAAALELCRSLENRAVPAIRIFEPGTKNEDRYGIYITARQHAWESGGSWVCRGLTEWLLSQDAAAEALRKKAIIYIVPVMDVDNVAIGAGGKEQKPQDHNRDWTEKPHFPAVAAAQKKIRELDEAGTFDFFIDLHNPGPNDRAPVFYVAPRDILTSAGAQNLDRFIRIARQEITGPLAYKGEVRESGANYDRHWEAISKNWVTRHTRPHVVALTLETCWNTSNSTTAGYLQIGKELGVTIEKYFRTAPRPAKK
ncbi:MAG TPA: M14-type cytosolic carboxypeptidase [Pirellulales bacterium]|jgi:hypothetical protein|nr:M14-type cytosolic carboxypeptidase [Pirellulales bacterium]